MTRLDGKTAIVTGAGSGIGAACARLLAERGGNVVVADMRGDAAERVATELGASALAVQVDVTDPAACERMVAAAEERFGRVDVAVNNAGVGPAELVPLAEVPIEDWRRVHATNLDGVFYSLRAEIPAMLRAGGGSIVNMASALGAVAMPIRGAYIAAKHGVVGLTRAAALDYSAHGIRVNAVGPGVIATPLTAARRDALVDIHPIGRLGEPGEVAELVAFLASDAASFCNGGLYAVDGGWTAH